MGYFAGAMDATEETGQQNQLYLSHTADCSKHFVLGLRHLPTNVSAQEQNQCLTVSGVRESQTLETSMSLPF